jgi:hypothetical protein
MKKVLAVLGVASTIALAAAPPAHAGSSTDSALALGAFAVFNQLLAGQTMFQRAYPPQSVYVEPAPPVYAPPPPTVIYTPPPPGAYYTNVLVQDGLRLPRSHQYELYNLESASYGTVRVDTVASYVRQGTWIYDRTAGAWVSHPSVGHPNPQYAAAYGRDFRREAPMSYQDVLVQDGLRLPRWHQYELYNHETASYGTVRVDNVASYVRQGTWIYDRTAGAWVSHPSVGSPNPQYGR